MITDERHDEPTGPLLPSPLWPWRNAVGTVLALASLAALLASTAAWVAPMLEAAACATPPRAAGVAGVAVALSAASLAPLLLLVRVLGATARPWLTAHRWLAGLVAAFVLPWGVLLGFAPHGDTSYGGGAPCHGTVAAVAIALTVYVPTVVVALAHVALGRSGPAGPRRWAWCWTAFGVVWAAAVAAARL